MTWCCYPPCELLWKNQMTIKWETPKNHSYKSVRGKLGQYPGWQKAYLELPEACILNLQTQGGHFHCVAKSKLCPFVIWGALCCYILLANRSVWYFASHDPRPSDALPRAQFSQCVHKLVGQSWSERALTLSEEESCGEPQSVQECMWKARTEQSPTTLSGWMGGLVGGQRHTQVAEWHSPATQPVSLPHHAIPTWHF